MQKADMAKADRLREMSGVNTRKCMKCGKCSATCPAYEEMDIRPHQFVSYVENGDIEPLLNSTTIWKCLSCFACVERCPRGVEPAKIIEAVRLESIRRKGNNHMTANDIPEKINDDIPQQAIMSAMRKYSK